MDVDIPTDGAMPRLALRVDEAATAVGLSRAKLYAVIARGELPVIRIDGAVRVPVAVLRAWVEAKLRDAVGEDTSKPPHWVTPSPPPDRKGRKARP